MATKVPARPHSSSSPGSFSLSGLGSSALKSLSATMGSLRDQMKKFAGAGGGKEQGSGGEDKLALLASQKRTALANFDLGNAKAAEAAAKKNSDELLAVAKKSGAKADALAASKAASESLAAQRRAAGVLLSQDKSMRVKAINDQFASQEKAIKLEEKNSLAQQKAIQDRNTQVRGALTTGAGVLAGLMGATLAIGAATLKSAIEAGLDKGKDLAALNRKFGPEVAAQIQQWHSITQVSLEDLGAVAQQAITLGYDNQSVNNILGIASDFSAKFGSGAGTAITKSLLELQSVKAGDVRFLNFEKFQGDAAAIGKTPEELIKKFAEMKGIDPSTFLKKIRDQGGQVRVTQAEVNTYVDTLKSFTPAADAAGDSAKNIARGDITTQITRFSDSIATLFAFGGEGSPIAQSLAMVSDLLEGLGNSPAVKMLRQNLGGLFSGLGSGSLEIIKATLNEVALAGNKVVVAIGRIVPPQKEGVSVFAGLARGAKFFGEALLVLSSNQTVVDSIGTAFKVVGFAIQFIAVLAGGLVFSIVLAFAAIGGVVSFFDDAFTAIKGLFLGLVTWVGTIPGKMMSIGSSIIDGLWNGIKSGFAGFMAKFEALFAMLPDSVKTLLGIASPSKVFAELGEFTAEGFNLGFDNTLGPSATKDEEGMISKISLPNLSFPGDLSPSGSLIGPSKSNQSTAPSQAGSPITINVTVVDDGTGGQLGYKIADAVAGILEARLAYLWPTYRTGIPNPPGGTNAR